MTQSVATLLHPAVGVPIGRIPVTKVSPVIEGGAYSAKAVVGEEITLSARVFREGHDAVGASAILTSPAGETRRVDLIQVEPLGLDIWQAQVRFESEGQWYFRIEGWSDPWRTWQQHAAAKLPLAMDVNLVCLEGAHVLTAAISNAAATDPDAAQVIARHAHTLDPTRDPADLLAAVHDPELSSLMAVHGPRELISPTPDYPIFVDRRTALFSAWYEFFPRSQGAKFDERTQTWTSGTFDASHERLAAAAAMGFDVVYIPPIHPIGSAFKKGKNNTLEACEGDPGSPWAIGSPVGGHDAIHPDLGDFDAFDRFINKAHELGLEVALDLALQASPDHPWIEAHPQWFAKRPDGTIAFAENPPKKYQDIYPLYFDADPSGLAAEILRIVTFWIDKGVTIFRVDNPHTKPVTFWAWLLREVRARHPEVLFLAEAFTRPEMMHMLGKIGFHQSYTYFTWRNEKWELEQYLNELSSEMADFYRPNFFVNTPDINPRSVRSGAPAAFAIRAILAATMSPTWGVYSGFELFEHAPLKPEGEEYLDSEKYEFRPRDFAREDSLSGLLTRLNEIRRDCPALQQLRNIHFHPTTNDQVICFSKRDGADVVLVTCSLDPHTYQGANLELDFAVLGQLGAPTIEVYDELTRQTFTWGPRAWVGLAPANPAHILRVKALA